MIIERYIWKEMMIKLIVLAFREGVACLYSDICRRGSTVLKIKIECVNMEQVYHNVYVGTLCHTYIVLNKRAL